MGVTYEIAQWAVRQLGIKGVSTVALVVLVALALYVHKLSTAGRVVVGAGSTAAHDAKVAVVTLISLLLLGVISADPARAQELLRMGMDRLPDLLDRLSRLA